MSRDLIISQHALRSTLEKVAEKSSLQQYQQGDNTNHRSAGADRVRAVMEAAASDPIGLHIMARTIVRGETYQQAISNLSRVRHGALNQNALMVRIHRLKRSLQT